MIDMKKNQLFMLVNEYQVIFLLAIIIDIFLNKGIAYSGFLLIYYFIILIISIIRRKKIKISLVNFLLPLFLTVNVIYLANKWDEEIKKKTIMYYNNSSLINGHEEKKITAYNISTTVSLSIRNNKKVAYGYLFNFKSFTYDDENKWQETERD